MVVSLIMTGKGKLVGSVVLSYKHKQKHATSCNYMYADITGRKKAIDYYLKEVQSHIEDAVLSLLTQASAALTSVAHRATQEEEGLGSFELKEKFAPMPKKNKHSCDCGKLQKTQGENASATP